MNIRMFLAKLLLPKNYLIVKREETFDYFVRQSVVYPYWWRNYNWWEDYKGENPIYRTCVHGNQRSENIKELYTGSEALNAG